MSAGRDNLTLVVAVLRALQQQSERKSECNMLLSLVPDRGTVK